MLFLFTYTLGMTPVEALYAIEMLPHAKAQGLNSLILAAALFASTSASLVAFQNRKRKYYFVCIGLECHVVYNYVSILP